MAYLSLLISTLSSIDKLANTMSFKLLTVNLKVLSIISTPIHLVKMTLLKHKTIILYFHCDKNDCKRIKKILAHALISNTNTNLKYNRMLNELHWGQLLVVFHKRACCFPHCKTKMDSPIALRKPKLRPHQLLFKHLTTLLSWGRSLFIPFFLIM